MARIVVAGSENGTGNNPTTVAVVDASNPAAPTVVMLQPNIGQTGAHVAVGGARLAVGAALSGTVAMFDLTTPASPQPRGSVTTMLSGGVGAVAVRGTLVVAGEWTSLSGARVALLDASTNPPTVKGTATTHFTGNTVMAGSLAAIGSVAFLSDTLVMAASPAGSQICLIDFTTPGSPQLTYKNTIFVGIGSADADAGAQRIVAADGSGGQVQIYDASATKIGTPLNTTLAGINSIGLSAPLAAVGSANGPQATLVDFSVPSSTSFQAQLSGSGATAAIDGTFIALGSLLGPFGTSLGRLQFFDSTALGAPLGHADVNLASISTLSIGETMDLSVSPSMLDFGVVAAGGTKTLPITVTNSGSVSRQVTALGVSGATGGTFAVTGTTPPLTVALNGGTKTVSVLFTAGTTAGAASATLTLTTTDPATASIKVSMSGTIGVALAALSPATLAFGSVAACVSKDLPVTVTNAGTLALSVTAATITGEPRLSVTTALPLTVAPGGSQPLTVRFKPVGVLGAIPAAATLTLTSNATTAPTASFTGSAVPSPPSLAVSASVLAFGSIPVQGAEALSLVVSNASACSALIATLSTTAPFSVETAQSQTGNVTLTGAPSQVVNVAPGGTLVLAIGFAPAALGTFTGVLTITHNDPSQGTVTVALSGMAATAPPTALELVLDHSGSMQDTVPGGTKMSALHTTVKLFTDLIPASSGDECGAVQFDSTASVLTPRAAWTAAQQSALTSAVNALQPALSTSIGAGLQTGLSDLSATTLARKVVLVFTDGMENTAPMIASVLPGIVQSGTEVYAVGLGRPTDISTAALGALAASSHGKFFNTDDALVLRKQFLQVLADAFRQNVAADPIVSLAPGRQAALAVELNTCDRAVTFTASWENAASSIDVTLLGPHGAVYTSASPANSRLIEYGQGATYAWYRVRFAPLDPGTGQFLYPSPAGQWQLQATAGALVGARERVALSVLVDSSLAMDARVVASNTTSPLSISVAIADNGVAVRGSNVEAKVTAPSGSLSAALTPAVVAQALAADTHLRNLRPGRPGNAVTVPLAYSTRTGRYAARLPAPRVDGVYQIEIIASGQACNGSFDRYASQSVYVAPTARGSSTGVTVTPTGVGGVVVVVVPVGSENRPLGPGFSTLVNVTAKPGGSTVGPVVDLGDGRYAYRIWWPPRAKNPTVTVSVAGVAKTVSLTQPSKPGASARATGRRKGR